jgi:hypothetical protein
VSQSARKGGFRSILTSGRSPPSATRCFDLVGTRRRAAVARGEAGPAHLFWPRENAGVARGPLRNRILGVIGTGMKGRSARCRRPAAFSVAFCAQALRRTDLSRLRREGRERDFARLPCDVWGENGPRLKFRGCTELLGWKRRDRAQLIQSPATDLSDACPKCTHDASVCVASVTLAPAVTISTTVGALRRSEGAGGGWAERGSERGRRASW